MNKPRREFWKVPQFQDIRTHARPNAVLGYVLRRHQQDENSSLDDAINHFSRLLDSTPQRVKELLCGDRLRSFEIDKLAEALNCSIFFLFGLDQRAFEEKEARFFCSVNIPRPTKSDSVAFRKMCEELLRQLHTSGAWETGGNK